MRYHLSLFYTTLLSATFLIAHASPRKAFHSCDSLITHSSISTCGGRPISSEHKRMTTRQDTIVFHSSAFNIEKGACLDVLLKQIPGICNKEGTLFWHEKETSLLINHREYFGGYGILSQLPCEAVREILIYNSVSTLTEQSHQDDQEEDYTIDICLTPQYINSWLGNIRGGLLNAKHYETEIDVIHLDSIHPLMGFVNINDRNKSTTPHKFLDTSSEIDQYGKQQYGALSYQHNWHTCCGSELLDHYVYLNTSTGNEYGWGEQNEYKEIYLYDNDCNYSVANVSHDVHQLIPTLSNEWDWTIDSLSSITFNADCKFIKEDGLTVTKEALLNTDPFQIQATPLNSIFTTLGDTSLNRILMNRSVNTNESKGNGLEICLKGKWSRMLAHNNKIELSTAILHHKRKDQYNSTYYIGHADQPMEQLQQYNNKPGYQTSAFINVFYKQWLASKLLLSCNYKVSAHHSYEHQEHYETKAINLPHEEILRHKDTINSYQHQYDKFTNTLDLMLVYNCHRLSFMPRLTVDFSKETGHHHRVSIDTTIRRNRPLWNPTMKIKWNIAHNIQSITQYQYISKRPDLLDIIPWIDNTNPLHQRQGNNRLRSSNSHKVMLYFMGTYPEKQLTLSSQTIFLHQSQPLTTVYILEKSSGSITTLLENAIRPTYGIDWHIDYHQYLTPQWEINSDLQFSMKNKDGFLTTTSNELEKKSNRQHFTEISISPQITYHNAPTFKCTVYSHLVFTSNQYKAFSKKYHHLRLYDYGLKIEKYWGNLLFKTDVHDRINRGYNNPHVNGHRLLWSASATYFCFKGRGRLQIILDDILNKTNLYARTIEPNLHTEIYKNKLHHYVDISFTYHFKP